MEPRKDRLDWASHHMLLALVTAQRSPDPNTQVGTCIVDNKNRVLSLGYNGPPRGMAATAMPWDREGDTPLNTKYPFVVHAEANAILNSSVKLDGSTLFCSLYPCNECSKLIISAGIRHIRYLDNPYKDTWQIKASRHMFESVDMDIKQHEWQIEPQKILALIVPG